MSEPQKLLLEIERLNKEIIKLKEVIENKNAHVESKNKHIARLEKIISIMKKGEPTIFDFPRRYFTIESNGCVFALQKVKRQVNLLCLFSVFQKKVISECLRATQ